MKRIFTIAGIVCLNVLLLSAQSKKSQVPVSDIDKKVDALIARMTLEEKVGQMTGNKEAISKYFCVNHRGKEYKKPPLSF